LEEVHKGNDCSYTICTEMVLQWHCLLCSKAIDCCSAFRHKLLDTERSVTSNIVTIEERNIGHSSGLCLHTASCYQLSATVQVSVYTPLHVTNCRPQFRSLSTHRFMLPTVGHSSGLCLHTVPSNLVKIIYIKSRFTVDYQQGIVRGVI